MKHCVIFALLCMSCTGPGEEPPQQMRPKYNVLPEDITVAVADYWSVRCAGCHSPEGDQYQADGGRYADGGKIPGAPPPFRPIMPMFPTDDLAQAASSFAAYCVIKDDAGVATEMTTWDNIALTRLFSRVSSEQHHVLARPCITSAKRFREESGISVDAGVEPVFCSETDAGCG